MHFREKEHVEKAFGEKEHVEKAFNVSRSCCFVLYEAIHNQGAFTSRILN